MNLHFIQSKSGVPGPVAVRIPVVLLESKAAFSSQAVEKASTIASLVPSATLISEIASDLLSSDMPRIHLGLGASNKKNSQLIMEIVELTGAVVSTTFSGKGAFPERHPLWLWAGVGPALPSPLQAICQKCDLWLILGVSFHLLAPCIEVTFRT